MEVVNLQIAWVAILLGLLAGTSMGAFFSREDWLGGYASARRRMVRLGHISLIGTGLLNLAFALSVHSMGLGDGLRAPSVLLIVGAVTMPLVCFLTAWRENFRALLFVPVASLIGGVILFILLGLRS